MAFAAIVGFGRLVLGQPSGDGASTGPGGLGNSGRRSDTLPQMGAPPAPIEVSHVVQPGESLSAIADRYETTIGAIMSDNGIVDPDSISAGTTLVIGAAADGEGPDLRTVPDSELVWGPAYADFDVLEWLGGQSGLLGEYVELVDGEPLTGAQIVDRVAREFSVGPRVLLAFVQARSGLVRGDPTTPTARDYPVGLEDPARAGLWLQLNWLADRLNGGFYDWRTGTSRALVLRDGTRLAGHPSLGPGSFAVQRATALLGDEAGLVADLEAFADAYRDLFGDPWATERPLASLAGLRFPQLRMPFPDGETWWFTGGPHGGWGDGSARSALDFVPDEAVLGCIESSRWAVAVADGVVAETATGQVWLDLDGDGDRRTGPVVLYLHLAAEGRVKQGARLRAGDPVGRPSCEGGYSNATHLHIARLWDGEWLSAAGPPVFEAGGWVAAGAPRAYDGSLAHADGSRREACECRQSGLNDVTAGAARRLAR